jgi:hypothetical protein
MFHHQRNHDHGQRAGRPRYHAGAASEQCGDQPDYEGGIQPDKRCHASHKGKGHGLGHQRQRHCQAGQNLD